MTDAGQDDVLAAQVLVDGLGLGRRFDDDDVHSNFLKFCPTAGPRAPRLRIIARTKSAGRVRLATGGNICEVPRRVKRDQNEGWLTETPLSSILQSMVFVATCGERVASLDFSEGT